MGNSITLGGRRGREKERETDTRQTDTHHTHTHRKRERETEKQRQRDLQMEDYAQGHVVIDAISENKSDGFVSGGLLWKNLLER